MHKIGVIQFPGSNTERETFLACKRANMEPVELLWNCSHDILIEMDGYIIVGGFSYEDRSRAGIIAALDPIMAAIKIESSKGKPVLGICNGAQILIESGLIPGIKNNTVGMALTDNKRIVNEKVVGVGYYNSWSDLKMTTDPIRCAFTRNFKKNTMINIPFAHGEGRFIMPEGLLEELQNNQQVAFKYANKNGEEVDQFPTNPNGSQNNIAAVCNTGGNVMAIMPHPERTTNGDKIFQSMKSFIDEKCPLVKSSLSHTPNKIESKQLTINEKSVEWIVGLVITDNEAKSVNKALKRKGYDVSVSRSIHWEINIQKDSERILNEITNSGELFNSNKEFVIKEKQAYDYSILVRQKDDVFGRAKHESLAKRFKLNEISYIKRGVIWNVNYKSSNLDNEIESILTTNIFYNPNSYEYYRIN
mgnify:FL=1